MRVPHASVHLAYRTISVAFAAAGPREVADLHPLDRRIIRTDIGFRTEPLDLSYLQHLRLIPFLASHLTFGEDIR